MGWGYAAAAVTALVAGVSSYASQSAAAKEAKAQAQYNADMAQAQAKQAAYNAELQQQNAKALANQAEIERQQGELALQEIQDEREEIRRDFDTQQGQNISLLSSGNVAVNSGSASASLLGNAYLFGEDLAMNSYNQEVQAWQTENQVNQTLYQKDNALAQADYLKKQESHYYATESYYQNAKKNMKPSLLTSIFDGVVAGVSSYATGGASIFGTAAKSASQLSGSTSYTQSSSPFGR